MLDLSRRMGGTRTRKIIEANAVATEDVFI